MGIYIGDDGRKITGGKKGKWRDKRKYEIVATSTPTVLGERKIKIIRTRGGNRKIKLLSDSYGNLIDENGKAKKVKILKVLENPANREYARRMIINKGAVVETEEGKAIVINRPGQEGIINLRKI